MNNFFNKIILNEFFLISKMFPLKKLLILSVVGNFDE